MSVARLVFDAIGGQGQTALDASYLLFKELIRVDSTCADPRVREKSVINPREK